MVVNGNPLTDIKQVGNIDTVVQAGRVYKISELKAQLKSGS